MHFLTQIPVGLNDRAVRSTLPWVDIKDPSPDHFALSWATLLQSITSESSPTFELNGDPVKVDLRTHTIHRVSLDVGPKLSSNHSAVIVGDPLIHGLTASCLTWTVDFSSRTSVLDSNTDMGTHSLQELGEKLNCIVQQEQSDKQVELSVQELPTLSISNPSPLTLPGPSLLHELALGGSYGANNAIEFLATDGNISCLSYPSLDRLSSILAEQIIQTSASHGAKSRQMVVPVLLPQSLDLYITWLAILKAGGAFCPLNIDAPPERIEFILQDVDATVLITQNALASRIPQGTGVDIIETDRLDANDRNVSAPTVAIASSNLAYIMYTSGSTGRPKGVGVSHLAATQSLLAHNDLIPQFDRFLQFASPTFDVSVFEVFFPFMRGATLIGCEREQMLLDISHVMTKMQVDAAELTPTVAGELLRTRAAAPCLKLLLTIGEMLTKHVVEEFGKSDTSDGILHGMYGPTEAAIHCTAATHFSSSSAVNLIGQPFVTVSAFIMSLAPEDSSVPHELEPLPLGEIGELVVGGPQLADGYINRPEENAKAFIDSPQYGRLYRTGDKARMSASGDIECFGRISSGQVKLRGQRIELGEIEHVICRDPEVRAAVAIVSGGSLASFVLVNDKGMSERNLRDICRQWLPRFMVPGEFILVDQFPQLPSGKIDRKALEAEYASRRALSQSADQQEFQDELEETIASCVSDILDRQVSPDESLVASGLDSLAAIRLASHLLDAGIRLDVAQVLDADCVEGLWQLSKDLEATGSTEDSQAGLRRIRQLVSDAASARIDALGLTSLVSDVELCSHIQQAMVLETARDGKAYCNWIKLEFAPSVEFKALKGAFIRLADQNPLLRSGFVEIGLKDHSFARFLWKLLDEKFISNVDAFNYDIGMMHDGDLLHPLHVQVKKSRDNLQVLVHIHHALYDGWSWQLILKDLHRILLGSEISAKPAYDVLAEFLVEYKLGDSAKDSTLFWRDQMQGISAEAFPNFHGRTDIARSAKETTRELTLSASKLNELSQRLLVGRQTILQAAFCYILSTYLGSDDVVFGTVFSGRTLPVKGIESIIGPCIRTLPTRMNLNKMQTVTDLLLAIQNMNRKSLEHGMLPLQDIKKASGIDPHQSLFDTAVVWQESIWSEEGQNTLFREVDNGEFLEFALLLEFEPRDDTIFAKVTYQNSLLPTTQANILLEQIDCVASILIESPDLPIPAIDSLLPSSVLSISNPYRETHVNRSSLVTGIETIAIVDPGRAAVEALVSMKNLADSDLMQKVKISYGQLNSQANRLAHYLVERGVTSKCLVALFFDKSMESCVSILALAKIGAGALLLAKASSETIAPIITATDPQFLLQDHSGKKFSADIPGSVSKIPLPTSLDTYSDNNLLTIHDSFRIVCTSMTHSNNESTKYVHLSHHDLQSHINAFADAYPTNSSSRLLQSSAPQSPASIIESFFTWHTGMTLCLVSDEHLKGHISKIVNNMKVTHLHLTPTLAAYLSPEDVPGVQLLLVSGEPLSAKVHQEWAGHGLYQGFETFGLGGVASMNSQVESHTSPGNVGVPLKNTSVLVASQGSKFSLLPQGSLGELYFVGDQIGTLISSFENIAPKKFIHNAKFGQLYKSGHYGRLLPDGSLVLAPRRDFKGKNGQFISYENLDRALVSSKLVHNAASLVFEIGLSSEKQLASVWVPSKSTKADTDEALASSTQDLFEEISRQVPSAIVPSYLIPVTELPMTENFRTDFARIQANIERMDSQRLQLFTRQSQASTAAEPLSQEELTISEALSAVVGVEKKRIGRDTSFYSLGLDSLSAIAFSRKLQDSGLGRIPVATILRLSSISQLSTVVPVFMKDHSLQSNGDSSPSFAFDEPFLQDMQREFEDYNFSVKGVYPCTPLQEAMLAVDSDADLAYFNHILLRVNVDIEKLKSLWVQMMERHEILRTCFRPTYDKRFAFAQIVLGKVSLPWDSISTSGGCDLEIEKKKLSFQSRSPVEGTVPYAVTVFYDENIKETRLLLSIHHALYDGEGIGQLLNELQLSLAGHSLPSPVQFRQFIDYMVSKEPESSDSFWDRYLLGVSAARISVPKDSIQSSATTSSQVHLRLPSTLSKLKEQCMGSSLAPLNVFHAAWARLLALYSGTSDVCFGNVFSCRTIPLEGVDTVVGPCFNTLPMRVKFSSISSNADIMRLSQRNNNEIMPHQLSPLRRVQQRALGGNTQLFDTLLVYQSERTTLNSQYWELLEDEGYMGFPLVCEIIPDECRDDISICLHFKTSHLAEHQVATIGQKYLDLVEQTIQYPYAQALKSSDSDTPLLFETIQLQKHDLSRPLPDSRAWSDQEELLRDILCSLSRFGPESVSLGTTIFQLGLDSINAVQLAGKLRIQGYKISTGDILEAASVAKIAAILERIDDKQHEETFDFSAFEDQHLQSVCDNLDIPREKVQSLRPCTPVQNGMLALFTHSNGKTYLNRMSINPPAPLDKARLKEAWLKVATQHQMLRTGFVQLSDQQSPFAMITYQAPIDIPWYDNVTTQADSQEKRFLQNLHQPPWEITVEEASSTVTKINFSALHALYDAQSLETIFSDVISVYEQNLLKERAPIDATLGPILVESQRQCEIGREFWQGMASEIHPSKFPDLHPIRADGKNLLTSSTRFSRPLEDLEASCRELGITLQAAGQAAWARLLAAYTGEKSVTFGTVLSGRNLSTEAHDAVFPCLVTMPSAHRIDGTNRELLDRTLKNNAALTKNQFTPLSHIQRWIGSDEPLFDTLFVYQKFSSANRGVEAWEVIDEETRIDYPVSIELIPHETDLEIRISHLSDLIPEEQAMVILNQYKVLLDNTTLSPESNSDDYQFLGNQLLSVTPAKEERLSTSVSLLHQFVEEKAKEVPDKTAFEFVSKIDAASLQKKTWSYREFNEDGNRVAHYLQSKGVLPGGMVAITFDKCPEASIAILGILKAGCAYLAIDPSAPISRKQFIMEDSGSKIVLCDKTRKTELESLSGIDVQALDEPGLFDGFSSAQPSLAREIQPDDTCYCLYTSGTTGTPKGCEITHDNAVQAMLAFQKLFEPNWDEDSRWLQFASFHFDVSVLEQYWSWSVGICVTSCPRDLLFEDLPGTIQQLQITHIDLTPSLARLVHPDEVPSLCRGVFITGGEQLKQEILDAWGSHGVIYNGYGPTEVTIGCTMLPRMRANDKPSNIGPQFLNVGSYVFRPGTSTPVVRGGVGELCVSGPLVGKGYLNRAELTKERFQELPEYEDRIYRTGDLVRILHDETFQFLGRIDDQVKLRGQRLEIGEINEVMKQATPDINEVATLVLKHPKQSKDQLVSFITKTGLGTKARDAEICFSSDDRDLLSTVKAACQTHLPGYMVPTHIIRLTRFPLSANNKADMKVLKGLYENLTLEEIQRLASMTVKESSNNAREDEIISVLQRFTGSEASSISAWSSIYELGLDSISVISFSRSLREAGFPHAQPSLVMKYPIIANMASALQDPNDMPVSLDNLYRNAKQGIQAFSHQHFHSVLEALGAEDTDIANIAPCTPLQEGIIYHFLSSETPMYCSSFTFKLQPSVDLNQLRLSWVNAQDEVEMLRARFLPTPDGYAQIVMKKDTLPWSHVEVSSQDKIDALIAKGVDQWIAKLGGLSGPLWEISVYSAPEASIMCLNIFHALYDGNSLALLLDLVSRVYHQQEIDQQAPSFFDVLHKGPLCKNPASETFWKSHLVNVSTRPLPRLQANKSSFVEEIEIKTTESLGYLRRNINVTEQAVLHACWLLALYQHFHFVPPLGIVASGRTIDIPGIADVIGPLFNTVPSDIQFHGLHSWREVAQRCHEYHVASIPFQHTALRDIVKWLGKSPDNPLFESLFVFQRDPTDKRLSVDNLWTSISSEAEHEYPLAFEITRIGDDSLTAVLATKTDILSRDSAREILSTFKQILNDFAQNTDHDLPYLNGVSDHAASDTEDGSEGTSDSVHSETQFHWSAQASAIREEVATLAGAEASSITETTSIFEVGLDSIDAIKLSSRLMKSGIKLPVSTIMRSRTIKAMSSQLDIKESSNLNGSVPLLSAMEKSLTRFLEKEGLMSKSAVRVLPATPIQEAMVAEMNTSGYKNYYNHEILQIEPQVDLVRLQSAWASVVRSHPILRTSFVEISDPKIPVSYAQIVHNEDFFDFKIISSNGSSLESYFEEQRRKAAADASSRPLLSINLVMDGDKRYLLLSIAHALYDGWSINLLHEDVLRSYTGEECSRPSPDTILEQVFSSSGDRAFKFWRAALSNCKPVSFPSRGHSDGASDLVHRAEKRLSTPLNKAEEFCRHNGVTMQALLVSCWSLLLATHLKQLDVVFGLVLSGRNTAGSENVMFPTMNTVAMRVILHGTRLELVKYVQETLLEMSEHQHFPLRRARPDSRSVQLFDTLFIYQKRPVETNISDGVLYRSTGDGSSGVEYPVCAEVEGAGEHLIGRVACRGNVLGEQETAELLDQMTHILSSVIHGSEEQTVDFLGDSMDICGYPISQQLSLEEEPITPSPKSSSAEWSLLESKIRNILAVTSGVPENTIEKEDTIFQLGLDSISAIKVSALLKKQAINLTVSDMLRAGTIANMAALTNRNHLEPSQEDISDAIADSLQDIDTDSLLRSYGIDLHGVQKVVPTTAGQSYFLAMNTLNSEVFYPAFYYKASAQLGVDSLSNAWGALVGQIPILRTAFVPTGKIQPPYIQAILQSVQDSIVWHDNIDQMIKGANLRQEFGKPPVVLHACQTSEGTALALKIHHALYDAVSLPEIMNRLGQLCDDVQSKSKFEAVTTNDISHLVALQHLSSPGDVRRQFWETYLAPISNHRAPASQVDGIGAIQPFYRPGLVSHMSRVEKAARQHGVSVQSIFLAVYARLHAHILGPNESAPLVVGLYLANRSHLADLPGLLAPTVNIVPLRLDDKLSDGVDSVFTAARKIQHDIGLISASEHANVSLMEIAEWTGVRISTCVNFLRLPDDKDTSSGLSVSGVEFKAVQPEQFAGTSNPYSAQSDAAAEPIPPQTLHMPVDVGNVFLPTIDIEAAVREDRLDFGVFAPRGRLDSVTAESMIAGMREEMTLVVNAV